MLIPSMSMDVSMWVSSLSRRVNANSQLLGITVTPYSKLIKKGEC